MHHTIPRVYVRIAFVGVLVWGLVRKKTKYVRGVPRLASRLPRSDETKRRMSVAAMGNTRGKGWVPSTETRAKIAAAHRGMKRSAESRENMRLAHYKCAGCGISMLRASVADWEIETVFGHGSEVRARHTCSDACREVAA